MSNSNSPIGVFDSGIGGLTVLEQLIKMYPNEDFYYVADQGHCPYGTKSQEYVCDRVAKICKHMENIGCKGIVIACNTASLQIKRGIEVVNIPVVSVIPPTCAKAVKTSKNHKIAVLATVATIKSGTYQRLIEEANCIPVPLACSEFVDFVEHNSLDDPKGEELVRNKLSEIKDCGFDTLIHGCTHFSLLQDNMVKVVGNINFVACGEPTGEYLGNLLKEKDLMNKEDKVGNVKIFTTGSVESALENMKWFKNDHEPVKHIDIE